MRAYDEHRAAGMVLLRKREDVDTTYPSLVAAARRSPSTRLTSPEEDEDVGEPEGDDAPGDDAIVDVVPEAATA